jgi:hypothetical protein
LGGRPARRPRCLRRLVTANAVLERGFQGVTTRLRKIPATPLALRGAVANIRPRAAKDARLSSYARPDSANAGARRANRHGAGWSSPVARQAHNLKVVGSNPTPATILTCRTDGSLVLSGLSLFAATVRMPARSPYRSISSLPSPCARVIRSTSERIISAGIVVAGTYPLFEGGAAAILQAQWLNTRSA